MHRLAALVATTLPLTLGAPLVADAESETYPASVASRPLALPSGLVQATAAARVTRYEGAGAFIDSDVSANVGTAGGELSLHAGFELHTPEDLDFARERFQVVGAAVRVPANTIAIDLKGDLLFPTTDRKLLSAGTDVIKRFRVSPEVLVDAGGGFRYGKPVAGNELDEYTVDTTLLAAAHGQITPRFGSLFRAAMSVPITDGYDDVERRPVVELEARMILTAARSDFFLGGGLITSGGSSSASMILGLSGRLP